MVQPPVGDPFPDCSNQQVLNILPPGNNGLTNAVDAATRTPEPHATDQQPMYANLKNVAPNLQAGDIHQYYKDAGFTLAASDIERTTTFATHPGTVILWDRFGVPHVYGQTRADTEFGAGYAAARDRLFVMDVLRHIGRSRLSQFIGPSPFAFAEDCTLAQVGGYSEQELTYQANLLPQRYTTPFGSSTEGQQVVDDGTNYVAGVNAYIDAAKLDPTLMPVEYAALPAGQTIPQHWSSADIVAVAAIVQSIFAVGGGDEVDSWFLYKALADKFGPAQGFQIWHDLRQQNDAGAPTTLSQAFPYMTGANSDSTSLPGIADLTSRLSDGAHYVCNSENAGSAPAPPATAPKISLDLPTLVPGHPPAMSNALLVDAAHSAGGHPIAVFGPQVAYFIPEILHEEDLHGPGIHARGAAFPGTDIYVELGHGTHYAWSATSAGSDLIDQRLELICDPATPTTYTPGPANGQFYWYDGSCSHQMYERTDSEQALTSGAAPFPPQLITFHIERTIHGPVVGRGTAQLTPYGAVPVAISVQRSTWFDELGAAPAFLEWNDPDIIHGSQDFLAAAARETGTFNWFYADANDIAYYSSGRLPQRSQTVNPNFIGWGSATGYEWQGFQVSACNGGDIVTPPGPDSTGASSAGATTSACGFTADWLRADGSAQDPHPHAVNPPSGFLTNWNNKPAPQWSAADSNFGFGSIYRVMSLTDRVQATLSAGAATPVAIVNDMEDAGSVDLDGSKLVPPMLTVLGPGGKADERQVIGILASWVQPDDLGAHRREPVNDPNSYQQGNAVAIMDALYPNLVYAIFDPWLGDHNAPGNLYARVYALKLLSNPPGPQGSAYDESAGGWESYLNTALRQVAGQPINDPFSQIYCGSKNGEPGTNARCRDALRDALDVTIAQLTAAYGTSDPTRWTCNTNNPPGQCNPKADYIQFMAVGAQHTDPIHWINRPTFQQVVQFSLP